MVIWRGELAHGNGENKSRNIRYAQYVTMFPVPARVDQARKQRITRYENRFPGGQNPYPQLAVDGVCQSPGPHGDPRQKEYLLGRSPPLTEFGHKLLGSLDW